MQHVLTHNNVVIMNNVAFFGMFPRQRYQVALKHLEFSAQDTWAVYMVLLCLFLELHSLPLICVVWAQQAMLSL